MKLKLLPIWRLKCWSKMGQIKKESQHFFMLCWVVNPPFCVQVPVPLGLIPWCRRVDLHSARSWTQMKVNLHLSIKLIVSVITDFCCAVWFRRNSLYFDWLQGKGRQGISVQNGWRFIRTNLKRFSKILKIFKFFEEDDDSKGISSN